MTDSEAELPSVTLMRSPGYSKMCHRPPGWPRLSANSPYRADVVAELARAHIASGGSAVVSLLGTGAAAAKRGEEAEEDDEDVTGLALETAEPHRPLQQFSQSRGRGDRRSVGGKLHTGIWPARDDANRKVGSPTHSTDSQTPR